MRSEQNAILAISLRFSLLVSYRPLARSVRLARLAESSERIIQASPKDDEPTKKSHQDAREVSKVPPLPVGRVELFYEHPFRGSEDQAH